MIDPAQSYLEERLLLAFARGSQDEVGRLAPQADWARMRALTARELIGGFLHRRLEASGLARFAPPDYLSALSAAYRKTSFDNLLLLTRLKEAAGALRELLFFVEGRN